MLEGAGLSIAMGNAPDDIKASCNAVTEDNNNDGVAKAIERYILSNN
jgi:hydroxymethylpyrimidine pyrophosphatase-like HAD family hydrolase